MTKRLWLVYFVSMCLMLPGCSEKEEPAPAAQQPPPVVAKPKPKPEPPAPPPKSVDLKSLIPPSLTVAMGATMASLPELSDKTGVDFAAEFRPATMILAVAGFQPTDVEEFWVGSNPATSESALCAKMNKQYDRALLRKSLQIGDPLGKIGGIELHALPPSGGSESAVAFVDEKTLLVGVRATVEAALKNPQGGPVKSGLAAADTETAAYWVAGGPDSYLQQLAFHGFSGFTAKSDANVPPVGFALAFPAKLPQAANNSRPGVIRNPGFARGRKGKDDEDDDVKQQTGIRRQSQLPKGKDEKDEEEEEERQNGIAAQLRLRNNKNNAAVPRSTGTVSITIAFAYEDDQQAQRMERRVRSVMDEMPEKLQTAASYKVAWTDSGNDDNQAGTDAAANPIGRFGRILRNVPHQLSRDLPAESAPAANPAAPPVAVFLQRRGRKGKDDVDDDDRRGGRGKVVEDDDKDGGRDRKGFGIGAPITQKKEDPGIRFETVNVVFNYEIIRENNNLRIQAVMDLPRSMVSVAAAAQQAAGGTLTGSGMHPGTLATVSATMNFWGKQTRGNRRGVRMVKGMPILGGYSWMTELLPYIGHADLYGGLDFEKSWITHPENHRIGGTVIPEFLNPASGNAKWQGYPYNGMGMTHFVGMSGVEDGANVVAAALKRSDPRAGFFGYDDIAKSREITDGAGKTIMVIGSGRLAGPWIQGGGATIRGAREPYFDELSGFRSPGLSTPGTVVLFADGSSREISADIDPAVFRAMCTIHGAETVDIPTGQPLPSGLPVPTPSPTPTAGGGLQEVINFFKPSGQ